MKIQCTYIHVYTYIKKGEVKEESESRTCVNKYQRLNLKGTLTHVQAY